MAITRTDPQTDRRRSVRDRTLETLRRRIITLELPPGAALSENELAADLGVSRTPVRESLILLREEGLVQVFPQVGSFVSRVDPARVAEAQFVREAIECASLLEISLPLSDSHHEQLRQNLRDQHRADVAGDIEQFFQLDEEFHRTLLRIAGHEPAWTTVNSAKAHLDRARRLSLVSARPVAGLIDQHSAVVDELHRGDVEQAVLDLRTHLRAVFEDVGRIRAAHAELFSNGEPPRPGRRTISTLA